MTGGYSDKITVDEHFCFKVPEHQPRGSRWTTPLCRITTFSLSTAIFSRGEAARKRVGVGMESWTHGYQDCQGYGRRGTVLSRSTAKADEAKALRPTLWYHGQKS
jgi:D-arabinose 1-dehydrogenase-like Zn-dependent alcohol dehydrogenase